MNDKIEYKGFNFLHYSEVDEPPYNALFQLCDLFLELIEYHRILTICCHSFSRTWSRHTKLCRPNQDSGYLCVQRMNGTESLMNSKRTEIPREYDR